MTKQRFGDYAALPDPDSEAPHAPMAKCRRPWADDVASAPTHRENFRAMALTFEMAEMRDEIERLREENERLSAEVARLKATRAAVVKACEAGKSPSLERH